MIRQSTSNNQALFTGKMVSVHFPKKWRHFVSPKTLLCFRVWGWGVAEIRFRSNVFSNKCSRCGKIGW